MESPNAPQPFMSQTSAEIYKSDKAPVMDAMFSITSQVFDSEKLVSISISTIFDDAICFSQESVQFAPELLEWTEPLIPESWIQSNRSLPYHEYAEFINPEVFHENTVFNVKNVMFQLY